MTVTTSASSGWFADSVGVIRRIASTVAGATGMAIVAVVVFAALLAPWITPYDPDALNVMNRFQDPSVAHWLGTDHLGRDLLSRLIFGSRIAMAVALAAISIAMIAGVLLGIAAASLPTRAERIILVLFDVIASFPSLVLALAVVAIFGPSTQLVVLIVAVTLIPVFGRVARAQVLTIANAPFIEAERLLGASYPRIVLSHLLPNIAGPLVVLASMEIPVVITIEAGLSFIGLGVRPPLASWGTLIYDGYAYLSDSKLPVMIASAALGLATLGFTLFGEALRDAVDPRLSRGH
jgi:peptide/nickel transport system permease protein